MTDAEYRENRSGSTPSSPPLLHDGPYSDLPRPPERLSPGPLGELLFQSIRASDRAPITCELRFNGENYGWEVQFLERGTLWYGRGAFIQRETAVRWAEAERKDMEIRTTIR